MCVCVCVFWFNFLGGLASLISVPVVPTLRFYSFVAHTNINQSQHETKVRWVGAQEYTRKSSLPSNMHGRVGGGRADGPGQGQSS